jgi:two-component system chemotaxis response regulator CheY
MSALQILVVDDSISIRRMIAACLQNVDLAVTEAADGEAACRIAAAHPFDLVITDQVMPAMDGLSLIRTLRAWPAYHHTPVLMLTTESGADNREQARRAGATGFLPKPFDPDQLVQAVRQLLVGAGVPHPSST